MGVLYIVSLVAHEGLFFQVVAGQQDGSLTFCYDASNRDDKGEEEPVFRQCTFLPHSDQVSSRPGRY